MLQIHFNILLTVFYMGCMDVRPTLMMWFYIVIPGLITCHKSGNFFLAKCEFGKARVTYLGKVVGGGQVRNVEAKTELSVDSLCLKTDMNFADFWVWQGTIEVLDNTLLLLWCH